MRHRRSGITRYLSELIHEFRTHPELGVDPVTPYRWVANGHLAEGGPDTRGSRCRGGCGRGFSAAQRRPYPTRRRGRRPRPLLRVRGDGARGVAGPPPRLHHLRLHLRALSRPPKRVRVALGPPDREGAVHRALRRPDLHLAVHPRRPFPFSPRAGEAVVRRPTRRRPGVPRPAPARIRGLPDRYLLYVGNRHPHKRVDILLRTFAELSAEYPDLHLVLAGALCLRRPRDYGARNRRQDRSTARLRSSASLALSSSAGIRLPVAARGVWPAGARGMATGCPVAMSDSPALLELGSDAALVFERDDPEGSRSRSNAWFPIGPWRKACARRDGAGRGSSRGGVPLN